MIHLLLGRPRTGKTHHIIETIKRRAAAGETVFLLVPEQQLYSAERDMLSVLPAQDVRHVSVLSFTRLCDVLCDRYGGRAHTTLTPATKALLMWHNLRELTGLMETYKATDASLCSLMLRTIDELNANGIMSDNLERAARVLDEDSALAKKLRDIALINASFDGLVREVCGQNPADRLIRAAKQAETHEFFKNSYVYIDGFTSFTAPEYAMLRVLAAQAADVEIALCADRRHGDEVQFTSVYDTIERLIDLGGDVGMHFTHVYRSPAPELLVLEHSLWRFDLPAHQRATIPEEEQGAIRLVAAPNLYEEAQAAALHILELAQSGIAYGDMAVVVRDVTRWRGVLDAALEQYHIPYFLSERTSLCEKPAARLILCALRCISHGWQTDDVISLCKTGLCNVDLRDMDDFADYVETWRIRGRRMTEGPWSMNPDGYQTTISERGKNVLAAANRVRETVIPPLMALDVQLKSAATVADQCRAIFDYLTALDVKKQLAKQAQILLDDTKGDSQPREAGELVRLWGYLTEALASVATVLPEDCEKLTPDELSEALSILFAESDMGSVPALHNCVTIGSANLLRVDNIRASLLLGLNEGEFPATVSSGGLLSEQDKQTLETLDVVLDNRADKLSSEELLYVWRAMTKPTEKLILSYSTTTMDGSPKTPSAAIARVRYLFPYIKPMPFSSVGLLAEEDQRYVVPTDDTVSRLHIHHALGESIWQSQSGLKTYAGCPYSYFGSHILKLRERMDAHIANDTAGTFVHHVMEHYLRRATDPRHGLLPLTDEESTALVDEIMDDYITKLCGDVSRNGRILHIFDRLRTVALAMVKSIRAELTQGSFLPFALEWDMSGRTPGDPLPMVLPVTPAEGPLPVAYAQGPLPLPATVDVRMRGFIDRVDVYRSADGKRVYIRVVDYKSSKHDFKAEKMVKEMNIQLMLYLFTLCAKQNYHLFADENGVLPEVVLPAQALYISPEESSESGTVEIYRSGVIRYEDEALTAISSTFDKTYLPKAYKSRSTELGGDGLLSPDRLDALETELKQAITEKMANLCGGQAHRTPSSDACEYCGMRDACAIAADKKTY